MAGEADISAADAVAAQIVATTHASDAEAAAAEAVEAATEAEEMSDRGKTTQYPWKGYFMNYIISN